jgi:hypothetical protein
MVADLLFGLPHHDCYLLLPLLLLLLLLLAGGRGVCRCCCAERTNVRLCSSALQCYSHYFAFHCCCCCCCLQEGEAFAAAAALDTHKALVHIFFATRSTKKVRGACSRSTATLFLHVRMWLQQYATMRARCN